MHAENAGGNDVAGVHRVQESSVRLLKIPRAAPKIEEYGFRLTRSKWDPYPWVCEVAVGTPASFCGLKAGDCILKVNGVDVLGLRIAEISEIVKGQEETVTLLCWNSGCDIDCDKNSICCAPMPISLKRLVIVVESILRVIECPVCTLTITPPVMQCQNGHLLCLDCRIRSEKCPMCRGFFTPMRSAVAEEIYSIMANTFKQYQTDGKLRHRIFGNMAVTNCMITTDANTSSGSVKQRNPMLPKNKFLNKLIQNRTSLPENSTQCNAAKLLRAKSTDGFDTQRAELTTSESTTEKRLEPRLTMTARLNSTNELRQMPIESQKSAEEMNCRQHATSDSDGGNHTIHYKPDDDQRKSRVENCLYLPHVEEETTPRAAAIPSAVNELLSDPPNKRQSKSMAALLLFPCPCKCSDVHVQKHGQIQ